MSVRWLNKSYGVLDLGGPKAVQDPRSHNDQSLLASQLDTRMARMAVEQQTLRTTSSLTQDALRKALDAVTEDAAEIFSRLDRLERSLGVDARGTLDLSPKYMTATLAGNQTANLAVSNHVEFDNIRADSGHITLSTGVGQAQGIFTVPAGVWQVTLVVNANYNGALGLIGIDLVEDPGGTVLSAVRARDRSYSAADNESRAPVSSQVISLASATDVKAEIAQSAIVSAIQSATHITFTALA